MNVNANAASEANWEELFQELAEEPEGGVEVLLGDIHADRYDFANRILMRRMRERLVAALLVSASSLSLSFGNKFFMTMNEQEQRDFFHDIFSLPVSTISIGEAMDNTTASQAITICTPALLENLPQLQTDFGFLEISNFALRRQSEVQELANVILARRETLVFLALESIVCPVDDCNTRDSEEPGEFLDPLFYAASGVEIYVSTKAHSARSTLVSPTALRALFVEGKQFEWLLLNGLGLTDSHVLAIVDGLSTPGTHVGTLELDSNPDITDQGYGALFDRINRANVVGGGPYSSWHGFVVDDKAWEGKLNLVTDMNSKYGRLEYLTNGTFTSEERRLQWLERVADLPIPDWDFNEEWEAKHLNFIWYTLCENPQMMQT
jgi:hypothetical protein